jgi:hypothetical protein
MFLQEGELYHWKYFKKVILAFTARKRDLTIMLNYMNIYYCQRNEISKFSTK